MFRLLCMGEVSSSELSESSILGEGKLLIRGSRSLGPLGGGCFSQEETFSFEASIFEAREAKNLEIAAVPGRLYEACGFM